MMKSKLLMLACYPLLAGCSETAPPASPVDPEPWSNEAEEVFQTAESLKHSLEQQKLEQSRLQELGVEGQPPVDRR